MDYALIELGPPIVFRRRQDWGDTTPPDVSHKGLKWVPISVDPRPTNRNFRYTPQWTLTQDAATRTWAAVQLTGSELAGAAEAEFEQRVAAVAGAAERDYYILTTLRRLKDGAQIPAGIAAGINWLEAMHNNLRALKQAIAGGATPDVTSGWPPAP